MKKFLLTLLMTTTILCIACNTSFALPAKVKADGVRVRNEASTSSSIVTILNKDAEVQILDQEDDWYKIKYNDYTGYIRKDLLTANENFTTTTTNNSNNNNSSNQGLEQNEDSNTDVSSSNNNVINTASSEIEVHVIPTLFSTAEDSIKNDQEVKIVKELSQIMLKRL